MQYLKNPFLGRGGNRHQPAELECPPSSSHALQAQIILFGELVQKRGQAFEGGVTEQELSDAKAYLIGSYPLGFDSNAKIAGQMMSVRQDNLGVDYFDRRNALIAAVTLDDVNRVADAYLDPARYNFVVVGEPKGLE